MSLEEQTEYFDQKMFILNHLHNFIDYEDIESPIKTIASEAKIISILPSKT